MVTSTSITWNRAIFFLFIITCPSNWKTNPIPNSLDKRSSCVKYSFTSLLFWLALQKHILDHYCTAKLFFGKGHTHKKLHTKSTSWKHSSTPHLYEKALYLPSVFLSSSPGVQSLLRPFSFIYAHSTCDLNWWNASSDLTALTGIYYIERFNVFGLELAHILLAWSKAYQQSLWEWSTTCHKGTYRQGVHEPGT